MPDVRVDSPKITTSPPPGSVPGHRRPWTPRRILTRFWAVARGEGWKIVWYKLLGETFYRRSLLAWMPLENPPVVAPPRVAVRIAMLTPGDLKAYAHLRPDVGEQEARRRLDAGHLGWVAWQRDRVVGELWASPGYAWVEYIEYEAPLSPDEVYLYQAFTAADCRHKGILTAMAGQALADLHSRGFRRLVGVVRPEFSTLGIPYLKWGATPFALAGYYQVLWVRKKFVRAVPDRLLRSWKQQKSLSETQVSS
jgi:hypothetical protein